MLRVRILDRVEDSNEFALGEPGVEPIPEVTIGHKVKRFSVVRVDRFPVGWEGELPTDQASNLISLGLAEAL